LRWASSPRASASSAAKRPATCAPGRYRGEQYDPPRPHRRHRGALALLGAGLGTAAGYIAAIAYSSGSSLDGLSSLSNVPAKNLLIILIGMPLIAAAAGWLFAGREPAAIAHQPIE
jgi:drug/metabolite transporter (DMT)-like permease